MSRRGKKWSLTLLAFGLGLALALALRVTPPADAANGGPWFVTFDVASIPPVKRSDTPRWIEYGTVDTDGFKELVFSFAGEFKEGNPLGGKVGAVLIPDLAPIDYLLQNEGKLIFPLEVTGQASGSTYFVSEGQTARVAFPRYKIYMYNETESTANVTLFVYRTRG